MTRIISTLCELIGLVAFVLGPWLVDWRAGLCALGLALMALGLAADPPRTGSP